MDELIPMRDEGWMKFTIRFVVFYVFLAALNEVVWRVYGTDTWVNFRTFVLPVANVGLHHGAGAAVPALRRPRGKGPRVSDHRRIRSSGAGDSGSAPVSATSEVRASVIASPASASNRIMCRKNTLPGRAT